MYISIHYYIFTNQVHDIPQKLYANISSILSFSKISHDLYTNQHLTPALERWTDGFKS